MSLADIRVLITYVLLLLLLSTPALSRTALPAAAALFESARFSRASGQASAFSAFGAVLGGMRQPFVLEELSLRLCGASAGGPAVVASTRVSPRVQAGLRSDCACYLQLNSYERTQSRSKLQSRTRPNGIWPRASGLWYSWLVLQG